MTALDLPLLPHPETVRALLQAAAGLPVTLAGMRAAVPGSPAIRLSVVLSNLRMQRMLDRLVHPGATVVDVGANIGYNTLYAAHCVGPKGRVYAVEPAQDNLAVLYQNVFANRLANVVVLPYAAGSRAEVKRFFLRGEVSAVNSLYQDSFYAPVTDTVDVQLMPLDDLVPGKPDLVKIDVEGAELAVLAGMARLLTEPDLRLIVEWHPLLQQSAGYAPDALPRYLLQRGFALHAVSHTHVAPPAAAHLSTWAERLLARRSPVELLALR